MMKRIIGCFVMLMTVSVIVGCAKQEMIRCNYTNETKGFTLSIDRPVEWTEKINVGWSATEMQEASPDVGIYLYPEEDTENKIYFCSSISPFNAEGYGYNEMQTVKIGDGLEALHGTKKTGDTVSEVYVFGEDFQGYYSIQIQMDKKDYKKYKKIISGIVSSCRIEESDEFDPAAAF